MVDQVHLEDGLVDAHGAEEEPLGADQLIGGFLFFVRFRDEVGLLRVGVKGILPQALFQTGLILAQLALNGRHGGVNGDKHIRGAFRHTDDGGAGTDGDFQVVPTLFHAEDDGGLGLGLEVAV